MRFVKLNGENGHPMLINFDYVTEIVPWANDPSKSVLIFTDARNGSTIVDKPLYFLERLVIQKPTKERKYI